MASKKEYHCSNCSKTVAKLDTEAGNQLRKGMVMLCDPCFKTFKAYEKIVAENSRKSHFEDNNPFADLFRGKF